MQRNLKVILVAVVRGAFTLLAALWIFLEEWVWDAMQACMAWIGKLPGVRECEARIARLPPYAALVAFLIPGAILVPFKLLTIGWFARLHAAFTAWRDRLYAYVKSLRAWRAAGAWIAAARGALRAWV